MNTVYEKASAKAAWRLIPFLILCYFVAYLDRVNAGFAALTMNKDLGLTAEMFGFGVGIFFFGYFIFEVPSNLYPGKGRGSAMDRQDHDLLGCDFRGIRIRALDLGGLAKRRAFVFRQRPHLLSLALHLRRGGGGVLSGNHSVSHLLVHGSRESPMGRGIHGGDTAVGGDRRPVVGTDSRYVRRRHGPRRLAMAVHHRGGARRARRVVGLELPDGQAQRSGMARTEERIALQAQLDDERKSREAIRRYTLGEALRNPRVLALSVVYLGIVSGNYGLSYWLPQIVKGVATEIGLEKVTGIPINALTGYLVAVPFAFGIVAMILWTRHSDATQERVWHVAGPATVSGLCLIAAAYLTSPVLAAFALTICAMGLYSALSTFWTLPTGFLTGSAAAGGIALINSIGNLGGFVGPYAVGWIKDATGETTLGLVVLAACLIMAGVVTLLLGHNSRIELASSPMLAE